MSKLFSPLKIRDIEFKNRIAVSPMCQYSAVEGFPTQWHTVHYGTRAVGGAGLIIQEATAVCPEGRISAGDLGLWNDEQTYVYKKITNFLVSQNCVPGIQLAHAGRKASAHLGWEKEGSLENNGWKTYAPSAITFSDKYTLPVEMTLDDINKAIDDFRLAAMRSILAGFKVIELHFAHGYLVQEFLSPLSNFRKDNYGGSFENRCRLALDITKTVRDTIPEGIPLFVRISSTEWTDDGWNIEDSVAFAKLLKDAGVDLIDCSSGGNVSGAKIPVAPGYQVPFASQIKHEADIFTGAVGLITQPEHAEEIVRDNHSDLVLLGREVLRNPYWPLDAAKKLYAVTEYPKQYLRAKL